MDAAASTVTVSAGLRWGDLAPVLHEAGFALHTLGSLPHISVAGSCATGTHGSGDRVGCLARAVSALRLVTAAGEVRTVRRRGRRLRGARRRPRLPRLVAPALQIGEIRTVAADDLWLSPVEGRDSLGLHFTWRPDLAAVLSAVEALERALVPFAARPHWGKVFRTPAPVLERLYERMPDARALAVRLDPEGKPRNTFLERTLFAGAATRP